MRRLIEWLYRAAFGLHLRSHDQHVADLRRLLFTQHHEKRLLQGALDAAQTEIDATAHRLLNALANRDRARHAQARQQNRRSDAPIIPARDPR